MRVHGTLTKWNDDRGFGFITPANASSGVFVHISAFPRDGVRPHLNELVSFEVEAQSDGKQRAVRILRPGKKTASRPIPTRVHRRTGERWGGRAITLLLVVGLGAYGYSQYTKQASAVRSGTLGVVSPEASASPKSTYSCDGRTMCSQMTSCAEARYFIRNCPNTQMDGDRDGEPCESQWCN